MDKQWNLIEAHGRQVLIRKGEDSDGNPAIQFVTYVGGGEVAFGISFEPDGQDFSGAIATRDHAFTKESELVECAKGFAERLIGCTNPLQAIKAIQS